MTSNARHAAAQNRQWNQFHRGVDTANMGAPNLRNSDLPRPNPPRLNDAERQARIDQWYAEQEQKEGN